jgi:hypothetical protein
MFADTYGEEGENIFYAQMFDNLNKQVTWDVNKDCGFHMDVWYLDRRMIGLIPQLESK